jgi:hypothetical protein
MKNRIKWALVWLLWAADIAAVVTACTGVWHP